MEINERIELIIKAKTSGRKSQFARLMGWSPQYLYRVQTGNVGITPIRDILKTFPDISARWLILGEGLMTESQSDGLVREMAKLLKNELER